MAEIIKNLKSKLKALDKFVYTDTDGVKANHFKNLPLKSKQLFIKILEKHFKENGKNN